MWVVLGRQCRLSLTDDSIRSTEFTGIACFTVRHKDKSGEWVDNEQSVDSKKSQ